MRRVLTSTISLLALTASSAFAADIPPRVAPYRTPAYVAPVFNWTGFYLGINGGYGWGKSDWGGFGDAAPNGGLFGVTAGYNWQAPGSAWVVGLEGDVDWTNLRGSFTNAACPLGCETRNNWLATLRGRVGYSFDRWLPYLTGGLAVGEPQDVMLKIVAEMAPMLPQDCPHYLMGVGTPHDLLEAVARGIDMFDCVLPTRNGRHGMAFTRFGSINLSNARHADDPRPLDERSEHAAARTYTRAYLHHLTKANEILGQVLLSAINLAYYQELMAGMRAAIAARRFTDYHATIMENWACGDLPAL